MALALGGLLVATNPGEREFEAFAGTYLAELATEEVCASDGLPLMARLVVHNCPQLVRSQSQALGRLAAASSHRYNFGLFSLYSTRIGGMELLPGLAVPRYWALTLAGAGQLLVLHTGTETAPGPS
jgi:hypothetical protein